MTDAPPDHPGPRAPAGPPEPPGTPEPPGVPGPPGTPVPPDELRAFIPPGSPADADAEAEDASRLVIEAVGQLPEADRDRVYAWLLRTGMRPSPTGMPGPLARQASWELSRRTQTQTREWGATVVAELVRGSSSPTQQMVPVRFSAEQHTRLRAWCAEHGFSMATVIRGLVDRFLESQQP
jgi:CO/xanthine dehydrogenase Mo-binding subunit